VALTVIDETGDGVDDGDTEDDTVDDDTDDEGRDITPRETPLEPDRRAGEERDLAALTPLCEAAQLRSALANGELVVWANPQDIAIGAYAVERGRAALTVRGIALAPGYRGRGLAARVLRELIDEAIRKNVSVACEVPTDAARALQLLRHLGFVVVPGSAAGKIRLVWRAG
jgi:ribosomal protein S18 acetylase RimI-like enzyme